MGCYFKGVTSAMGLFLCNLDLIMGAVNIHYLYNE